MEGVVVFVRGRDRVIVGVLTRTVSGAVEVISGAWLAVISRVKDGLMLPP
jgi:hypothetical protein